MLGSRNCELLTAELFQKIELATAMLELLE